MGKGEQLLNWLRAKLLGLGRRFFRLDTDTFLQMDGGRASIVREDEVPRRYRQRNDADDALPTEDIVDSQQRLRTTRIAQLRKTDPYKVAKHANRNEYVRYDVLQNPELVNADSRFEAELKLAVAKGEDIQPIIDSNPHVSESDVKGMLETDFMVKWGYTVYGDELASKLNDGDADESDADVEADGDAETADTDAASADAETGGTADASKAGEAGEATSEGSVGKAVGSINTATGDVDISTEAGGGIADGIGEAGGEAADGGGAGAVGGDVGGDVGGGEL